MRFLLGHAACALQRSLPLSINHFGRALNERRQRIVPCELILGCGSICAMVQAVLPMVYVAQERSVVVVGVRCILSIQSLFNHDLLVPQSISSMVSSS